LPTGGNVPSFTEFSPKTRYLYRSLKNPVDALQPPILKLHIKFNGL
jgi:hypothetical protein